MCCDSSPLKIVPDVFRDIFLRRIFRQISLLLAVLPALVGAAERLPDTRPRAGDAELREALQAIRTQHAVPGMAAALFDADSVRAFAVGESTPGGNPVTPDSRFRAGQLSLLFTGMAVAALVTDGSMPAEGELGQLAPEVDFHNPWSGSRPVRIADLLAHRAGLGPTHFRDVYAESPGQPLLAGINSAFRALRLTQAPGEREQYSVVGYAIAAYLAEKAVGFTYDDMLARMIFRPLEMRATLGRPDGPLASDVKGHAGWPAREVPGLPLNLSSTGDIWISANDLARVGQLLLNEGRHGERPVLPAGATAWMLQPPDGHPALVPGARHGVHAEEFGGFLFYTQTGALPGYLARFAFSPELGRGYVVLLNHGDAREALAATERLLRGQLLDGAIPGPVPAPAATAMPGAPFGWYRRADHEPPPRALYDAWLGYARLAGCGDAWCFSTPGQRRLLQPFDASRLRAAGHWQPGWSLRGTESGLLLENATESWHQVAGWRVALAALAGLLVMAGTVLAMILLPWWSVMLPRRRVTGYRALLPRLLPLAAMLALIACQVLLFSTGYPELGEFASAGIAILVLSILGPVLAVLALAAAVAGFAWQLPARAVLAATTLALAALVVTAGMATSGLVAFQTWNY